MNSRRKLQARAKVLGQSSQKNKYIMLTVPVMIAAIAGMMYAGQAHSQESSDRTSLGLGVGLFPKYAGSKDYSALPLPLVTVRSKNFYWIGLEGGYAYPLNNMFSIGPLVSLERGRDQDDAGRLRGLGDIDTTMGYGAFVNGRFGGLNVTLKYVQSTKSAYGGRVGLDAFYMWRLGQQDRLTLSASTIWGNNKYMQTNFGVTEAQAATSEAGLQTYNANSGFQHVRVGTTWVHAFNPNWSMLTMVGATSLVGKTKDSPVVEKTTSLYSTVGVIYSF